MQTHRDDDSRLRELFGCKDEQAAETLAALKVRAREMVAKGESQIAAGKLKEKPIGELSTRHGFVTQLPEDPLCLRISIGESMQIPNSTYLVFRGDPVEVQALLTKAVHALGQYIRDTSSTS